ncbi:unnamed protein product [Diabrotica balteata]|uniref:C2H2-type domain-containing protein n=1 Tax=Diabrotica balteata TaxID=107213 RepID=A0A9N9T1H1_DIABA|nr:unnamed protein product [Diabrotica balteata]
MESKSNRETLENIVIGGDGTTPQYMIQRVPENAQLLSQELLQQQHGLVVDLGGNDFIPVSYASEDLLTQDLTEEDRNLAAALVAVQLSQQQKQQQLQDTPLPSLVATSNLGIGTKILDESQLIISSEKGGGTSFLRIVNSDNIYVEQQPLNKLVDTVRFTTVNNQSFTEDEPIDKSIIKKDDDKGDSDRESLKNEPRTSKKSLPHKKRISRKLKKSTVSAAKNIVCNLCEQSFSSSDEFAQHEILCQTTITPVNQVNAFNCQICNEPFTEQLKFFEHLKKHYEPGGGGLPTGPPKELPSTNIDKKTTPEKTEHVEHDRQESLLSSLLNLSCIECNKTFRRQKTLKLT